MKRLFALAAALLVVAAGCAHMGGGDWVTLIDGEKGLENFNQVGDANWHAAQGAIVADKGKGGYLVSKKSYKDFVIYAEFYAENDTNSGIFLRASDPVKIASATSYEVNIWDIRPDPTYGTGAIVDVASVPVPLKNKAGGRWNTYEIYAKGPQLIVKLNGEVTSSAQNTKHAAGPFALQYGAGVKGAPGGVIKWRKVMIKEL
ncbi:MAG: DUF1080 domain-containing protein [Rhodospirillaceae bacterium]